MPSSRGSSRPRSSYVFKSHDTLFMWTLVKKEVKGEHEPVTNSPNAQPALLVFPLSSLSPLLWLHSLPAAPLPPGRLPEDPGGLGREQRRKGFQRMLVQESTERGDHLDSDGSRGGVQDE